MYIGYELTEESRNNLLERFTPKFPKVICHHITEKFGVTRDTPEPEMPDNVSVVGYASNDIIEALVVSIDGSTARPDGKVYHITLSLDPSRAKPVMSNDLIAQNLWERVSAIPVDVIPKNFFNN